jgi:hypothetical protein
MLQGLFCFLVAGVLLVVGGAPSPPSPVLSRVFELEPISSVSVCAPFQVLVAPAGSEWVGHLPEYSVEIIAEEPVIEAFNVSQSGMQLWLQNVGAFSSQMPIEIRVSSFPKHFCAPDRNHLPAGSRSIGSR